MIVSLADHAEKRALEHTARMADRLRNLLSSVLNDPAMVECMVGAFEAEAAGASLDELRVLAIEAMR